MYALECFTCTDGETQYCCLSLVPRLLPSFLSYTVKAGEEPGNEATVVSLMGPYIYVHFTTERSERSLVCVVRTYASMFTTLLNGGGLMAG